MKNFYKNLKEYTTNIINYEKKWYHKQENKSTKLK